MSTPSDSSTPRARWYVYVLYSPSTGLLYTGVSTAPTARLERHNLGKGGPETRVGRPWLLVRTEEKRTKGDALKRELEMKQLKKNELLVLAGLAA